MASKAHHRRTYDRLHSPALASEDPSSGQANHLSTYVVMVSRWGKLLVVIATAGKAQKDEHHESSARQGQRAVEVPDRP